MSQIPNHHPTGFDVPGFSPPPRPDEHTLVGKRCRMEPLSTAHAGNLFEANATDKDDRIWIYLPYGPFESLTDYSAWIDEHASHQDPWFYAIIDQQTDQATGVASYLRITPASGSIEVGHINFSPLLQNTVAATEAMYLMMKNAFALGYRGNEWMCDALNQRSCNAAKRLGFQYEGTFRQATVYKGRNRDTAWYSIIDREWPALDAAFQQWLSPDNFDDNGGQRSSLSTLTSQTNRETIQT